MKHRLDVLLKGAACCFLLCAGCQCGSFGLDDVLFACRETADCREGYLCRDVGRGRECIAPTSEADSGAGDIDGGDFDAGVDAGLEQTDSGVDAGMDAGLRPVKLGFAAAAQTVPRGHCTELTVQTLADDGALASVAELTPIEVSAGPPGVTFFSDSNCAVATTSLSVAAETSWVSCYARASISGVFTLTASAASLQTVQQQLTVTP